MNPFDDNDLIDGLQTGIAARTMHVHAPDDLAVNARRRARRGRPQVLAGSTLGLAGVGAALVVTLGSSATPPAFAVTQNSNGSVTVQVKSESGLIGANRKLAAMGIDEGITYQTAPGAAPTAGPVKCLASPSDTTTPTTPVSAYLGNDNTQDVPSSNTGAGGVEHVTSCTIYNGTPKIHWFDDHGHRAVSVTEG